MIRYLIKNNIKMMSRSSINILAFVLAPLLVSAVLMSAFSTLMEKYEDAGSFTVGYSVTGENTGTYIKQALEKISEDSDITFVEYPSGDIENTVNKKDLACFIDFDDEKYKIYEKEEFKIQGKITELSVRFHGVSRDLL